MLPPRCVALPVRPRGGYCTGTGGSVMMSDNLFLKILNKEIPAKIVHEGEHCLAVHDVRPQAPVHVLIIPRKVIATHDEVTPADRELIGHLHVVAARLAGQLGLTNGYRLVINCKEQAGQTV